MWKYFISLQRLDITEDQLHAFIASVFYILQELF